MLSSLAPLFPFALALAAAQNLVANGNFDEPGTSQTQASPWYFNPSQIVSIALGEGRTGNAALLQSGANDQPSQISQSVRTDGSTAYTLSFWAKTTETQFCSPSSDAGLDVGLLSGQLVRVDVSNIAADWKDFRFQIAGEDSGDQVVILGRGACFAFLIDDVSLTQGSAGSPRYEASALRCIYVDPFFFR
ncbi:hypothetical protein EXIGLDRAFT_707191 [Exidia glandulosa HHB12029]|uniref:CBM-cenC domain-containing protein n=1 Tax=Exidia glandulosa HHB12029 TaxID=1314781 RepID=A0A165JXL2_EXIGL|nr:hypothetical protein EXIGLDRAFT_707191 [Exidia glandulosa HHB12029]